jgi:cytochrome c peroxidase
MMKKRSFLPVAIATCSLFFVPGSGIAGHGFQWGKGLDMLPPPATSQDFYDNGAPDQGKVELGKLLFYDKILSGNLNISCATCHHALTDTGDGLSLPVGEGGTGLGVTRNTGYDVNAIHERIPRNAPPIFNLGAREFQTMFHDGRVTLDDNYPSGITSPAGYHLPEGLDNVLAAQAMFPVTSSAEMCGQEGENDLANYCTNGELPALWAGLALRLSAIPKYVELFKEVFVDIEFAEDITYTHAANAIAAFEAVAWRADNSPFDRYLRGEKKAMSKSAISGMKLFYGEARCFDCHKGTFQTDHQFHAVAMPQIGPGRGDGWYEDYGREQVTGMSENRYQFRTPTLRNVALTGPWGHTGAFNSLEAIVRHFANPVQSLYNYDTSQAVLPSRTDLDDLDFAVMNDPAILAEIAERNERQPVSLTNNKVAHLVDFLNALTDPSSIDLRLDVPNQVPSSLPLYD